MHKLVLGSVLAAATVFAMPALSAAKSAHKDQTANAEKTEKPAAAAPLDKESQQKLKEHLRMRDHIVKNVKYPATKQSLVTTFRGLRDIKQDDRKWFEETLPNRTYDTPADVMKALGWEVAPSEATAAREGK